MRHDKKGKFSKIVNRWAQVAFAGRRGWPLAVSIGVSDVRLAGLLCIDLKDALRAP
ncbi:hypothetical protein SS05631_b52630 (plasmid) [Sinorhizobium sp. CCBAU 05631]|uniref:Uncharacterized protein n=1 Tax=Rhizobium fredii TaxID=380 RepID=A0A2L0HDP9_RHIFR|nr:hypothetical protein SS05631_b52630 [Sinorhizobium sp. CCBAU 05631]AUX79596.1 hypothetical protein NXT3_PC00432 [Sinorhizobium fredii]